jgi:hypothetical protein
MDQKESLTIVSTHDRFGKCYLLSSASAPAKDTDATSPSQTLPTMLNDGPWNSLRSDKLQWLPEIGIGWFPVTENKYDEEYWKRYRQMDMTPVGTKLTAMRMEMVSRWTKGQVIDIGIGGGRFCSSMPNVLGYDVNPSAVQWLRQQNKWFDPYRDPCESATFWDSLEHIADPAALLCRVEKFAFISIPIFKDCADVLRSKHYRKDEHIWYFTVAGLQRFMAVQGFRQVERTAMEQRAGRQMIESYCFQRHA